MNNYKIKLELNPSELRALFLILNKIDFTKINNNVMSVMARFILKKVYFKIVNRLQNYSNKKYKMTLHQAEGLAMIIAFETIIEPDEYEQNLIIKILMLVDQISV